MKRGTSKKGTLAEIAKRAGISKTSASYALRNLSGVSPVTRKRVTRIAKQLGYFPDARLASRMTGIRLASKRDFLPIAWLNTHSKKNAWREFKFLSPYQEGARARCEELGYRIEEIWTRQPGLTMRRISEIIDQQGIEGAIISDPARHFRLKWDRLAVIGIGGGLLAPGIHRVIPDINFDLKLALKSVKRFGYQRIGVYMSEEMDRFSQHDARATTLYFNSKIPPSRRVKPLFSSYYLKPTDDVPLFTSWLKRERPDAVIGASSHLASWIRAAGYRVPEDVGVVHLAVEEDVSSWAGIYANKREVGRLAADMLISLIQTRAFGVPKIPSTRLVRGFWQPGETLFIPKPSNAVPIEP